MDIFAKIGLTILYVIVCCIATGLSVRYFVEFWEAPPSKKWVNSIVGIFFGVITVLCAIILWHVWF